MKDPASRLYLGLMGLALIDAPVYSCWQEKVRARLPTPQGEQG